MQCLYCGLWEVHPEAVAGLCKSCEWSVRLGLAAVENVQAELFIVRPMATYENPLGSETGTIYTPYEPEKSLPSNTPQSIIQSMREELLGIADHRDKPHRIWSENNRPQAVIREIRELGIGIELDRQCSVVRLSHPRRVPYPLLCEFVEFQDWIADELSYEDRDRIRAEQQALEEADERNQLQRAELEGEISIGEPT